MHLHGYKGFLFYAKHVLKFEQEIFFYQKVKNHSIILPYIRFLVEIYYCTGRQMFYQF